MHEALRHHTLLQLKTVGTPPGHGLSVEVWPNESNAAKIRADGSGGMSVRNILGNHFVRDHRTLTDDMDDMRSVIKRTVTNPCPVDQAVDMWAAKGPAHLELFPSQVSTVQRLMIELLEAADEFRRLHIGPEGDDCVTDTDHKDDDVTTITTMVSNQLILYIKDDIDINIRIWLKYIRLLHIASVIITKKKQNGSVRVFVLYNIILQTYRKDNL